MLESLGRAGHTHFGQTGAHGNPTGDKGGTTGCAALLDIIVGKVQAFIGNPVDIGLLRHVEFVEFSSSKRYVRHESLDIENERNNRLFPHGRNCTLTGA